MPPDVLLSCPSPAAGKPSAICLVRVCCCKGQDWGLSAKIWGQGNVLGASLGDATRTLQPPAAAAPSGGAGRANPVPKGGGHKGKARPHNSLCWAWGLNDPSSHRNVADVLSRLLCWLFLQRSPTPCSFSLVSRWVSSGPASGIFAD